MSVFGSSSALLTLRPRVKEEPPRLVIRTGWIPLILSLGLLRKKVTVDTARREMTFATWTLWVFRSSYTLSFDDLHYLEYAYHSFGTSWGWSLQGFGRQDEVESYVIQVVDQEGGKHDICKYRGEGAVYTGWSGMLLSDDDAFDLSGTQDVESRRMVDYLKRLLGVPLGKPLSDSVEMRNCPHCGREVGRFAAKCVYCAKPLTE